MPDCKVDLRQHSEKKPFLIAALPDCLWLQLKRLIESTRPARYAAGLNLFADGIFTGDF
jgi:hypothetical protein